MLSRNLIFAVLLVAAIFALVSGAQLPSSTMLLRELQNAGHVPLFGVLALALLYIVRTTGFPAFDSIAREYLAVVTMSLTVGVITELVQWSTGRQASAFDLLRDLIGIVVALAIYLLFDPHMQARWAQLHLSARSLLLVFALALLFVAMTPLLVQALHTVQRDRALPVVMDFSASWSAPFVQLQNASLEKQGVRSGAHFVLQAAQYPGIKIDELYADWSDYKTLRFSIYSPAPETYSLVLRVHDRDHDQRYADRFNRALQVEPGANRYSIQLADIRDAAATRKLDMTRIGGLILFAVDLTEPVEFYLSVLSLDRS
jgi:VanZ family protein